MTFEESIGYLRKAALSGPKMGLERMEELLALLGEPQKKTRFIHIAGTNGKGSVSVSLENILKASGYRTGSYTTPALTDITDCYRIDGKSISRDEFALIMETTAEASEKMEDKPSEYEVMTAAAFVLFEKMRCDTVILECCMGGDTDCTNVIDEPVVSVITNIQKDHTAFLGDTLSEIAKHKAGIIKKGCPVVTGCSDVSALDVIKAKARECGSELSVVDEKNISDISVTLDGTSFIYKNTRLKTALIGVYQAYNTALVYEVCRTLSENGFDISETSVSEGLERCVWKGRFEILRDGRPLVLYDGGHNKDGIERAAETMSMLFGEKKCTVLMGVMSDKEYESYADILCDSVDMIYTVTPDNPRSLDSKSLAKAFEGKIPSKACDGFDEAVAFALDDAIGHNRPLVCMGSLYMYKDIADRIKK